MRTTQRTQLGEKKKEKKKNGLIEEIIWPAAKASQ